MSHPFGGQHRVEESEDEADVGALVVKAAEQLLMVGPAAVASVRFSIDGQWFLVKVQMVDGVDGMPQ